MSEPVQPGQVRRMGRLTEQAEEGLLTYGGYLKVPELLSLQQLRSDPPVHDELQGQKIEAILATGATTVASANPGCTMQISAGLRAVGRADVEVVHPIQLLDRAERT